MRGDSPSGAGTPGPGTRIGRYLLERQLGRGGMAAVFTAHDDQLGRAVALKIMAPELAADERFRQRFIRESRAAAAVDHPHIIPVFEAGQADSVLFIAMRYVPGGDVRSLLFRAGTLALERAAAIVSPVASALDAAHAAGLVHRDVKPANMLLDTQPGRPDHVYLSDFGLTKDAVVSSGLTGTGLFLGTVDYASPEQINGLTVDGRTDQYALACAAYEMLTGQPPFVRDQPLAVLAAHLSHQPPPVSTRRNGLPQALDTVFRRALAKSPDDRYSSCGEFGDALRGAAGLAAYDSDRRGDHPRTEQVWPELAGTAAAVAGYDSADTIGDAPAPRGPGTLTSPYRSSAPAASAVSGRGRRRPTLLLSALIAAAALAAVAAIVIVRFMAAAQPGVAASTPTATPTASWSIYHDPSGFSVSLPAGWTVISRAPEEVRFAGSPPGFVVVVAWSHQPQADALADWRQQASAKSAADPTYQQIRVQRVSYRGYNAADWEFTNVSRGVLTHVIDRTFIVRPGRLAYAVELYGPQSRWASVSSRIWPRLLATFQPGR